MAFFLSAQVVSAAGYTITVKTDLSSYTSGQEIKISGAISPAPGAASTAVLVRIFNPSSHPLLVYAGEANVSASTGDYNATLVAGGSSEWTTGTYTVNATWGGFLPPIFRTTTFTYTATTTTTTSTTSSTSTTATSTTSSTTTSSTTTSSSTTSSTTTTSSSSPTTSSTTTTQATSSSTAVPEFPYQAAAVGVLAVVIAVGYALARKSQAPRPSIPAARRG
jgi:hypothetical protein